MIAVLASACSSAAPDHPLGAPPAVTASCEDADGDGYGVGCPLGHDCDDADPDVWRGCGGSPDAGAGGGGGAPLCGDGDTRSCKVDLGWSGAVKSCFVGVQVCATGAWSPCEVDPNGPGGT